MKDKLLIVTEDIVQIQTFSGKLGRLYSFLYQFLLKLKLSLIIYIFHYQYDITILATDKYNYKSVTFLSYSEQFDPIRIVEYKPLAWKLFTKISKSIDQANHSFSITNSIPLISLWENKITSRLMNYYLSYLELLTRLIVSNDYSRVVIIGNSIQEQFAKFLTTKHKIKLFDFSLINLNGLTNYFFRYFRHREMNNKITIFKTQAQKPKLSIKSPVLISVDFYRHLKTLVPVYQQLKKIKAKPLIIAEDLLIKSYLKNFKAEKSNFTFLASFLEINFINNSIKIWKSITNAVHKKVAKRVNIKPKTIEQLILQLMFPEISPIIKQGLILSKLYLLAGEKLIKAVKPRYLVVAADVRLSELSLSYLAKIHNIPSITVSPRTIMFEKEPFKYNQSDYISVTGQCAKDQLIKLNVPPNKIIINGDPRYDYFSYLEKRYSTSNVFNKLGIKSTKKKIILLISERPNLYLPKKEKKDIFLQVSQVAKKIPNTILVIKPHPTEKKYRLLEELKQWGITNAIVSDNKIVELFDLLKLSSVIVMVWSMTGIESMILRRPVMIINPHNKDFDKFIPYLKNKAAVQSDSIISLKNNLNIYLDPNHPKTKELINLGLKFTEYYVKKPDGNAAQRISQHIIRTS